MNKELLETFNKSSLEFFANSNSLHSLGTKGNKLINVASRQICDVLNLNEKEIIYTSGGLENDNLCILGFLNNFENSKHVLVEDGVSAIIVMCLNKMKEKGFSFETFSSFSTSLLKKETVLICFKKDIYDVDCIPKNVKKYISLKDCKKDYDRYDFLSIDGYDLCNLAFMGCLIKNKNINLEPIIHGGKSVTLYRSGTPSLPLIVTLSKAVKLKYNK